MSPKPTNLPVKIGLILGAIMFFVNGVSDILNDRSIFGIIQLVGAALNSIMLFRLKSITVSQSIEYIIFFVNSIVALIIAYDYIKSGADYIQYVWILTALLYILVIFVKRRRVARTN